MLSSDHEAQRIRVDDERVAVYIGNDTEFEIYCVHYDNKINPVWASRDNDTLRFSNLLSGTGPSFLSTWQPGF